MSEFDRSEAIRFIREALNDLEDRPLEWIYTLIRKFNRRYDYWRNEQSDIITDGVLQEVGFNLRSHHYLFSHEPLSKDRFEYLLEQTLKMYGYQISMPGKGNPGHDITINGVPVSLKTQADKGIKGNQVYISKFMEMGKGQWSDNEEELKGLRERFLRHMDAYERIIILRCIEGPKTSDEWRYELVEIPKDLFLEAEHGELQMMHNSTQMPKPGYCTVYRSDGRIKYMLYFDGGNERKLQIKAIDKSLCTVHANWVFPV